MKGSYLQPLTNDLLQPLLNLESCGTHVGVLKVYETYFVPTVSVFKQCGSRSFQFIPLEYSFKDLVLGFDALTLEDCLYVCFKFSIWVFPTGNHDPYVYVYKFSPSSKNRIPNSKVRTKYLISIMHSYYEQFNLLATLGPLSSCTSE